MTNSNPSQAKLVQIYHLCFVILLTAVFLFVMLMSGGPLGFSRFEDNFYKRNLLIENFNRLRLQAGDHVFNNVLVGNNGWMEYRGDGNLDDYQNAVKFSAKELKRIGRNIQSCYEYAREQNITFLIVVAPNKATIYPDKLPDQIQPLSGQTRLDQLNTYLREQGLPEVLDLRPALLKARQTQDIYYRTGTHWNEPGAYVAYEAIIHALSSSHPELSPYPVQFLQFRHDPELAELRGDRGVANLIQANYIPLEENLFATRNILEFVHRINLPGTTLGYHRITWIPDSDLPTLLLFHDSFGVAGLNSFLSMNFSKVSYVFRQASAEFLTRPAIEMFAPDILLYEVVERNLPALETDLAGCAAK